MILHEIFNFLHARATPCAWLPADAAIIPWDFCLSDKLTILLYEPLFLNEKIGCKSSLFKKILFFSFIDKFIACVVGESIDTS